MSQRVREGRLYRAVVSVPTSNVFFFLSVWPVACQHDTPVKFGYRQCVRGTKSYYAHCKFQLSTLDLAKKAFGDKFVACRPWGDQPTLPLEPQDFLWWNGGEFEIIVTPEVPLTVIVCVVRVFGC